MNLFEVFVFTFFLYYITAMITGIDSDTAFIISIFVAISTVIIDAWYKLRIEGVSNDT